jgi:hypothetical protein
MQVRYQTALRPGAISRAKSTTGRVDGASTTRCPSFGQISRHAANSSLNSTLISIRYNRPVAD